MIRMRMLRLAAVVTGLITAATVQVAVAPLAQAGVSGLQRESGMSALDSQSPKIARAQCDSGMRPVSGGFLLFPATVADQKKIVATGSRAIGTRWEATAAEVGPDGTNNNWRLFAFAICAPQSQVGAPVTASSSNRDEQRSIQKACGAGEIMLGSGAEITPPTSNTGFRAVQDIATRAGSRATGAVLLGPSPLPTWTLLTSATCVVDDGTERRQPVRVTSDSDSEAKGIAGSCPPGMTLTGTGASITGAPGKALLIGVFPNNDALTGASASAVEAAATAENWTLTLELYCGNH